MGGGVALPVGLGDGRTGGGIARWMSAMIEDVLAVTGPVTSAPSGGRAWLTVNTPFLATNAMTPIIVLRLPSTVVIDA